MRNRKVTAKIEQVCYVPFSVGASVFKNDMTDAGPNLSSSFCAVFLWFWMLLRVCYAFPDLTEMLAGFETQFAAGDRLRVFRLNSRRMAAVFLDIEAIAWVGGGDSVVGIGSTPARSTNIPYLVCLQLWIWMGWSLCVTSFGL